MKNLAEFLAARRFHDSEQGQTSEAGTCINCEANLADSALYRDYRICEQCRFHYSLGAHRRIELLVDPGSFRESNRSLISIDPLGFRAQAQFRRRMYEEQRRTGLSDAIVTGTGAIAGRRLMVAAIDFRFLGGSIGCAVGEKLARAIEQGARKKLPVLTIVASGGVRMQEGVLALMQFAKLAEAAGRLAAAGEPHVVLLANPSLGGAYAVLGGLADFVVAEPGALIGYATTRRLEETSGRHATEGSRTAESHLARGLIDEVVDRPRFRDFISSLLEMLASRPSPAGATAVQTPRFAPASHSAWSTIQMARHAERPTAADYIGHFSDTFVEIRGDRVAGDDRSIVAGIGILGSEPVVYVGSQRTQGGSAASAVGPAGFRKARRAYELGARLNLPIVTLIDSVEASPTIEAEESGIGAAVASCMATLSTALTPVVAAVIGEARGEAALAMCIADRVLMLEHAVFEVVSPETAASIIYRDTGMADSVATSLRPTARDCVQLGIVDAIVPEPAAGAHTEHEAAARLLSAALLRSVNELRNTTPRKLVRSRYSRHRRVGQYANFMRVTVGHDVAQLGGDIARRAGGALARLTRRAPRGRIGHAAQNEDADASLVP